MVPPLEILLGALLFLFVLLDVFLTVFCARMGIGIISRTLARSIWVATALGETFLARGETRPLE